MMHSHSNATSKMSSWTTQGGPKGPDSHFVQARGDDKRTDWMETRGDDKRTDWMETRGDGKRTDWMETRGDGKRTDWMETRGDGKRTDWMETRGDGKRTDWMETRGDDKRTDWMEKGEGRRSTGGEQLCQHDLLYLLSILDAELQVKDEVITVLKAEKMDSARLEAHYGFGGPESAMRALQRDSLRAQQGQLQDVYEKPMDELDRLVASQRRSSRRMLQQLVEVERSHSGALCRLEEQERNHRAFIQKSDDLTALLEQDRERLKLLIVKDKEYRERKEEETEREVSALHQELTELKAFALLVVNEQQSLTEQLEEQHRRVQELTTAAAAAGHANPELAAATHSCAREEGKLGALQLQAELQRSQASILHRTQEAAMTAKLATEDAQNQQLRQRLVALSRQLDELEGTRDALRRAGEELQELRDRVRRGEEANERAAASTTTAPPPLGLLSEVEALRRRVVKMEGKDEELIRMGDQCRDLDRRLGRESSQCRSLKAEVDKLNGRISELDRIEEALGKSRQECSTLKSSLEKERGMTKQLSGELDTLKGRVRELEAVEAQLDKTEGALRQDLAKLRTLTVALVEDRKTVTERLRQAEQKLSRRESEPKEQNAPAASTAVRMREERQQVLRSKTGLEERIKSLAKENDELLARLRAEEERNGDLQSKVNILRKRAQVLESRREKGETDEKEMDINDPPSHNSNHGCQIEDNKIKELSQEVDMLRKRLQEKEVVEGELIRVQEDFESLELSFGEELERSKALARELEEAKRELSKYQLAEKQEVNQEHHLLRRLQQEQVKSRLLAREVDALKEKLHGLMGSGTEESISRVQVDHSTLHKKLSQQEARNRELAREMEELTGELERYRRFSKSLRPGVNGRRFSDLHQSTKEVQTEQTESHMPPEYSNLSPLEFDGSDEEEDPNHNEDPAKNRRHSTPVKDFKSLNHSNNVRRYSGQSANGMDMHLTASRELINGNLVKKGDVVLTHTPGQPLQIKVTPDHGLNTATLEISSPTADAATSYTSTAVIPTSGVPPKQRITIIQNLSAVKGRSSPSSSPERALSPLTITSMSQVTSPDSSRSVTPDDHTPPPVQIVTVNTCCSPEPTEVAAGQTAVFRMSPERQNSWHVQRSTSSSTSSSPSVFTTEDNKIHIHLGSPYIQGVSGMANGSPHPGAGAPSYYSLRQEQRTQILTNGHCHVKGGGKITSSITITPTTSPVSLHPSNITIPVAMVESLQKPSGPTRIPKPKGFNSFNRGTNNRAMMNTGQNNIKHPPTTMYTAGKNTGLRMPNRPKATSTT